MMMDLSVFRVRTADAAGAGSDEVEEVYYVPEFVSVEEEEYLMRKVSW
jgi:hypothetical protein